MAAAGKCCGGRKGSGQCFSEDAEAVGEGSIVPFFFSWIIWHTSMSETLRRSLFDSRRQAQVSRPRFLGVESAEGEDRLWVGFGGGGGLWLEMTAGRLLSGRDAATGPLHGSTRVALWG